jgi:hypothetical protein
MRKLGACVALVFVAVASLLTVGGCASSDTDDDPLASGHAATDEAVAREVVEVATGEHVEEAALASTAGDACRAYCAAAYAAACLRIQQACTAAEVVTIGGATVACATAISAVCIGSAALGVICAGKCTP